MNRVFRKLRLRARLTLSALLGITVCTGIYFVFAGTHPVIAAMFMAMSFYILVLLAISYLKKDYCVIHPYFSKRLSVKLPHTAFNGKEIAAHLDELDARLHENGFRSVSDFGYQQTNIKKMHRPEDLLRSLIFLVQDDPIVESDLRLELCKWIEKISIARDEGAFVALHMRIADSVSGLEIDRLPGTY